MDIDYFKYNETNYTFNAGNGDFITFIGSGNDYLIDNIMYINKNNYININYFKVNDNSLYKYRKLVSLSSIRYIDTYLSETVTDELVYNLESLAYSKSNIKKELDIVSEKFKLSEYLECSPKELSISKKVILSIASAYISKPKLLVIDNMLDLLDYNDYLLIVDILNNYIKEGNLVFNFTNNIEESLLGNKLIISNKDKILISGNTLSVLNEENIMKRLGIGLPFKVLLNRYFMDYKLIDKYYLDYKEMGNNIWK